MLSRWILLFAALVALGLPAAALGQSTKTGNRRPIDTNADTQRAPAPPAAEPVPAGSPHRIVEEGEVERNLRQGDAIDTSRPEDRIDSTGRPAALAQWYGHAFVYVVSSTGVRVAIDPYAKGTVDYNFPRRLPADLILVSNEADDHSAAERFIGSPQVFRSVYAVGMNRANGMLFKGAEVSRERRRGPNSSSSTAFTFEMDGVRFAHLGAVGDTLNSAQRRELGRVDVVFLGVGDKEISVKDLNGIVKDLDAKVVVPIKYGTDKTTRYRLRTLDEYLAEVDLPVKRAGSNQFKINRELLPEKPHVYVVEPPLDAAPADGQG